MVCRYRRYQKPSNIAMKRADVSAWFGSRWRGKSPNPKHMEIQQPNVVSN